MENKPIDIEATTVTDKPAQAMVVREKGGAIDRALSVDELRENLNFIKEVMQKVMVEGQDYGKIPGCGDKPGLFQPGAQKLLMTFQLTDEVKEERVNDLPNYHREYSFVVRLKSSTGRTWEGVGTCSTLEGKYRYRKAERRCPKCGKNTIINGKAEYGGGFLCFAKKGGCGAKFPINDKTITDQPGGQVENENPADHWNTVRKMAFKRALVHASINATNTSELWSQDLEDLPNREASQEPLRDEYIPKEHEGAPPTRQSQPAHKPAQNPAAPVVPTVESRAKMIAALTAGPGMPDRDIVTEYFVKVGQLLPSEQVEDLPLRFVPGMTSQMKALKEKIFEFGNGGQAAPAFPPNVEPPEQKKVSKAQTGTSKAQIEVPRDQNVDSPPEHPDEWFFNVIVPIPRRGQKRADYLKDPDTIGSLYDLRHGDSEEAHSARQRLWGFVSNYEATGWTKSNGEQVPPTEADHKFRKALDEFQVWFEKNHPDEKL